MYVLKRFLLAIVLDLAFSLCIEDQGTIHPITLEFLVSLEFHLFIVVLIKIILQFLHLLLVVFLFFTLHKQHELIITGKYVVICD